jgi:hypothetical protein
MVDWSYPCPWIVLGLCCTISGVPTALFLGQPTLLALAGVLLASFKAPVALLAMVYILAQGERRGLVLGGILCAAVSAQSCPWLP